MRREKWEYKEHTKVKHEILKKYLRPWIIKLGKYHRKIIFFDGFAGRGEYIDEKTNKPIKIGSPIIAIKLADQMLKECRDRNREFYFDKFICVAVEKNKKNFENLKKVVEEVKKELEFIDKNIFIELINNEFTNVVGKIIEEIGIKLAPTFFFIDPWGFKGVPIEIVKHILALKRTEILFTFMSRDINRFLNISHIEKNLYNLFGTDEWKKIIEINDWQKRDIELLNLYHKSLREIAKVKYILSFRVCMDEKYQTLYYLIHATNHFDGLKIMKDIMYNEGAGKFAWLGPEESQYRYSEKLFDETIPELKKFLLNKYKDTSKKFKEILEETYSDTRFIESQYKKALLELESEDKIKIPNKGPRGGIKYETKIIFIKNNPIQTNFLSEVSVIKIKIYYKRYTQLNGNKKYYVEQVDDGSIIKRFDKTPLPSKKTDIVCPHFLELKWAYGCPYDCAWCYLKGTFRFRPQGKSPVVKPYSKIRLHVESFLKEVKEPEILNTGEIADSLMYENTEEPFSKFIIPLFETQNLHKVLFLTKSSYVKNLLEITPHNQVIISFSLNAIPVAQKWERAPSVLKRIEAAKKVFDAGYEVRIRIDPMVPIQDWQKYYLQLIDLIFDNIVPERITLGSLRGLQSTINGCTDKTWVKYLKETSNWGKKIDFKTRFDMYKTLISYLKTKYKFINVALCKETVKMWEALEMDYKKIKCNCVW